MLYFSNCVICEEKWVIEQVARFFSVECAQDQAIEIKSREHVISSSDNDNGNLRVWFRLLVKLVADVVAGRRKSKRKSNKLKTSGNIRYVGLGLYVLNIRERGQRFWARNTETSSLNVLLSRQISCKTKHIPVWPNQKLTRKLDLNICPPYSSLRPLKGVSCTCNHYKRRSVDPLSAAVLDFIEGNQNIEGKCFLFSIHEAE
jgi:hypothetical protein